MPEASEKEVNLKPKQHHECRMILLFSLRRLSPTSADFCRFFSPSSSGFERWIYEELLRLGQTRFHFCASVSPPSCFFCLLFVWLCDSSLKKKRRALCCQSAESSLGWIAYKVQRQIMCNGWNNSTVLNSYSTSVKTPWEDFITVQECLFFVKFLIEDRNATASLEVQEYVLQYHQIA